MEQSTLSSVEGKISAMLFLWGDGLNIPKSVWEDNRLRFEILTQHDPHGALKRLKRIREDDHLVNWSTEAAANLSNAKYQLEFVFLMKKYHSGESEQ